eukprot:gene7587-742_t
MLLQGGENLLSTGSPGTAVSSSAYNEVYNQLALVTTVNMFMIPLTTRTSFSSDESISSTDIAATLLTLFDGDVVVFENVRLILMSPDASPLVFVGQVILQGLQYAEVTQNMEDLTSGSGSPKSESTDTTGSDDSGYESSGDEDSGPGDSGPDDSGSGDSGPDGSGSGDSGPDDSGSGDSGSGESGSGDSGSGDSGSGDSGSGDSGPGDSGSGDSVSGESVSVESVSGDSGSGDSVSGDSGSGDSGPDDSGSADSGSVDSAPVDSAPVDSTPVDSGSVDSGSVDSGSVDNAPADSGSVDGGPDSSGSADSGPSSSGSTSGPGRKLAWNAEGRRLVPSSTSLPRRLPLLHNLVSNHLPWVDGEWWRGGMELEAWLERGQELGGGTNSGTGSATSSGASEGSSPGRRLLYGDIENYDLASAITVINCQGEKTTLLIGDSGEYTNLMFNGCTNSSVIVNTISDAAIVRFELGGAVYVASGAQVNLITDSLFDANGGQTGSNSGQGGAIYSRSACISLITRVFFSGNGNNNLKSGGAIYIQSPTCSPAISNTTFYNNSAASSGGAVMVYTMGTVYTFSIIFSSFVNNKAGSDEVDLEVSSSSEGGGLCASNVFGTLEVSYTSFVNNTSRRNGGAISTLSTFSAFSDTCIFRNKSVSLGQGGAWSASKEGVLTLTANNFTGNTALYGGALEGGAYFTTTIKSSNFTRNRANYGGAVECTTCTAADFADCLFLGNSADSGGAIALEYVYAGSVAGCTFSGNAVVSNVPSGACGRTYFGGGGGMCVTLQGDILFTNNTFVNNVATNGAALKLIQTCNVTKDATCGIATIKGCTFTGNSAEGGGGGAIYAYEPDDVSLYCQSDSTDPVAIENMTQGCLGWENNTASYGDIACTAAARVVFFEPTSGFIPLYLSKSLIALSVGLQDSYGNLINAGTAEASATFAVAADASNPQAIPSGNTVVAAVNGNATFSNLVLQMTPGIYSLTISVSGTSHDLTMKQLRVEDTYSFNPANTTCDTCPKSNAVCDFNKTSDAVQIGNIVVPVDGYWHSNPLSPQILECPNSDSCTVTDRSILLKDFQRAVYFETLPLFTDGTTISRRRSLLQDNETVNWNYTTVNAYQATQCADGYQGALCAICQEGYGQTGEATCIQCVGSIANAAYYILMALINVVLIVITIKGQLSSDNPEENGNDDEKDDDDDDEKGDKGNDVDEIGSKDLSRGGSQKFPEDTEGLAWGSGGGSAAFRPGPKVEAVLSSVSEEPRSPKALGEGVESIPDPTTQVRDVSDLSPSNLDDGGQGRVGEATKEEVERLAKKKRKAMMILEHEEMAISSPSHSIVIKILVSYLQVAALLQNINLSWPSSINSLLSFSNRVTNGVSLTVSLDCSLSNAFIPYSVQKAIITVCSPLVILFFSLPIWIALYQWSFKKKNPHGWTMRQYLKNRLTITIISVVFFVYPGITETLLSFFTCPLIETNESGVAYYEYSLSAGRYWSSDYSLKCYEGAHLQLVVFLGIPGVVLFAIGVPIFSWWFLSRHKDKLREPAFVQEYGFIYGDYRDDTYYWESIVMGRKFFIVLVVVFFSALGTAYQILVALGVLVVALVVQMIMDPFRRFAKFMPYGGYGPVTEDLVKHTRGEIGFGASSVWAKSITGALARERMHRMILADQVDTSIDGRPPSARRSATATRPISRNSSSRGSNRAEAPAARRLSFGLLGGNKVAPSPTKDEAADEMVLKSLQVSDEEGTNQTNEGQIRPQVLPLSPSRSKSLGDKSDPSSLWRSLSGAASRSLSPSAVREEVQLPNATDP